MSYQTSIKEPVRVDGLNVYNGRRNYAIFHPLEEDKGLIFRFKSNEIPISLDCAQNRRKAISLDNGRTKIYLVEHVLSAAYALGIDNLLVELYDGVCPTTDNCSAEFFDALMDLRTTQNAKRKFWRYCGTSEKTIRSDEQRKPDSLTVMSSEGFVIDYLAYYPHKVVGEQNYRFDVNEELYEQEIMAARSPAFLLNGLFKEIFLALGRMRLHGINERNNLLITSKKAERYANPPEFGVRYGGQEFVRHKILDVLGTLALTGRQFRNTEFQFHMTGHKFDLYALKKLFDAGSFREET